MKIIKAKYKDEDVVITYVNSDVSWALITLEKNNLKKKFKVNCSQLEDVKKLDLINMSNNHLYNKKEES
jgi:hypothetical protein